MRILWDNAYWFPCEQVSLNDMYIFFMYDRLGVVSNDPHRRICSEFLNCQKGRPQCHMALSSSLVKELILVGVLTLDVTNSECLLENWITYSLLPEMENYFSYNTTVLLWFWDTNYLCKLVQTCSFKELRLDSTKQTFLKILIKFRIWSHWSGTVYFQARTLLCHC